MQASTSFRGAFASSSRRLQASTSTQSAIPEFIAFPEFVRKAGEQILPPNQHDEEASSETTVRQSKEARDGSLGRIGMVELPSELQLAVHRMVEGADKPRIRQRALVLYDHLRSTSSAPPPRDQQIPGSPSLASSSKPFMDGPTALAYTAGVMPSVYASTRAVLGQIKGRFGLLAGEDEEAWVPKQIVDWGAGVGTGGWAAQQVWPDEPLHYVSLDSSRSLQTISSALLSSLGPKFQKKLHQTSLGAPDIHSLISSSFPSISSADTLALAAYTLGDLPSDKIRRETVRSMWDSGAEVIVIIDRGTPKGADIVKNAREQLLRLGRHNAARGRGGKVAEQDLEDELVIGGETFVAEVPATVEAAETDDVHSQSQTDDGRGCYVVAPCPHDGRCPLHKTKNFCHFSQKVQRPSFLRKTKHSGSNEESSSYSYVAIRRGSRPSSSKWPRLVVPPLKRGGHVILDGCTPNEKIERWTVAKSHGKQKYYDARKSKWGDLFPHYEEGKSIVKSNGLKRS